MTDRLELLTHRQRMVNALQDLIRKRSEMTLYCPSCREHFPTLGPVPPQAAIHKYMDVAPDIHLHPTTREVLASNREETK